MGCARQMVLFGKTNCSQANIAKYSQINQLVYLNYLRLFVSRGAVKAVPESCSEYNLYGQTWGLFYLEPKYNFPGFNKNFNYCT